MQTLDAPSPRRRYRRWRVFAATLLTLAALAVLAITWGNAWFSRETLRQQLAVIRHSLPPGWHLILDELSGELTQTRLQLRVLSPLLRKDPVLIKGQMRHRLLHTNLKMTLETERSRQTLASLDGRYGLQWPALTPNWNADIEGSAFTGQDGKDRWSIKPWNAQLEGNGPFSHLWLNLQGLNSGAEGASNWSITDSQLDLALHNASGVHSGRRLHLVINLDKLRFQAAQSIVRISGLLLQAQLQTNGESWPFKLELQTDELLSQGFPFARLNGLEYRLTGDIHSLPDTAESQSPPRIWSSRHQLNSTSNYGPLTLNADLTGSAGALHGWKLDRALIDGQAPAGLWDLIQRLYPDLTDALLQFAQAQQDGSQYRFSANFDKRGAASPPLMNEMEPRRPLTERY